MSGVAPIDQAMLGGCAPPRVAVDADKEGRGQLLVLAGGTEVAGAAILTGVAGLRVGAGKLQMAVAPPIAIPLALAVPEARIIAVAETDGEIAPDAASEIGDELAGADAVVIGPGMLDETAAGALAGRVLKRARDAALVIDAGALTGLTEHRDAVRAAGGRLVVTPHAGEMAQLSGRSRDAVEADPLRAARETAAELQAVVVMKGAETLVVTPSGQAWSHRSELPGLGTSGSGDVLAGAIGGLLARGCTPVGAAAWGVALHARAGALLAERVGSLGFLARELLDELPRALEAMSGGATSRRSRRPAAR